MEMRVIRKLRDMQDEVIQIFNGFANIVVLTFEHVTYVDVSLEIARRKNGSKKNRRMFTVECSCVPCTPLPILLNP